MEENRKFGKQGILELVDDIKKQVLEKTSEELCKEGWNAFNANSVPEAILICSRLKKSIEKLGREPTRREKQFIDTIQETIEIEKNKKFN